MKHYNEVRFRFNDITYAKLKSVSEKSGLTICKICKNIIIQYLNNLTLGGKK